MNKMRSREEILEAYGKRGYKKTERRLFLEVLLDIRDLLSELRRYQE